MSRSTIVLVHGAWHGSWCWDLVGGLLEAEGADVIAIDLPGHGASTAPLTDLHGDAAAVTAVLDRLDVSVVLVGHSYGGAVVTEAGAHPRVDHLVYIAAFNLDEGETVGRAAADNPSTAAIDHSGRPNLRAALTSDDGGKTTSIVADQAKQLFYNDCTTETATWATARLGEQRMANFSEQAAADCMAGSAVHLCGLWRRQLRAPRSATNPRPAGDDQPRMADRSLAVPVAAQTGGRAAAGNDAVRSSPRSRRCRELFANRVDAGRRLASKLLHLRGQPAIVLGLPRGGVPIALEVARALHVPIDVIVVRKLGVPFQPELAMGAIGEDGTRFINDEVVQLAQVSASELDAVEARERIELDRRAARFRGTRPRQSLVGRTAIVVDDGIATGSTARAACQVARAQGAARIVLAVPVAPPDWTDRFRDAADELVCIDTPRSFHAVGEFYKDFSATTDEEVIDCLAAAEAEQ